MATRDGLAYGATSFLVAANDSLCEALRQSFGKCGHGDEGGGVYAVHKGKRGRREGGEENEREQHWCMRGLILMAWRSPKLVAFIDIRLTAVLR